MFEAMNEFGVDTLKAARALEEAGFETRQAETLVTVFRGFAVGDAATRSQLRDFEQGMKTETAGLQARIEGLQSETRTEIEGLRSEIKAEIEGLRSEMKTEIAGLRSEMKTEIAGLKTRMYQLMLGQTVVIIGLIVSLDRLL